MSTISSPRPHPWERLCCGRAFPAPISISIANPTNSTPSSSTALCRPSPIRALCASRPDLGTIPRVVADAREIYASRLTLEEGLRRIDSLYKPYHAALRGLMERAAARFGVAVLIDCHSMPSTGARDPLLSTRGDKRRIDFVIGDRYGASAFTGLVDVVEDRLRGRGYHVMRNRPYAGGFITEHYGKPAAGWHALQIEVSRGLYMDEVYAPEERALRRRRPRSCGRHGGGGAP